jgi:hypothetical protein
VVSTVGGWAKNFSVNASRRAAHPLLRKWEELKAGPARNRPPPGASEQAARRLIVLLRVALERTGLSKAAARNGRVPAQVLARTHDFNHDGQSDIGRRDIVAILPCGLQAIAMPSGERLEAAFCRACKLTAIDSGDAISGSQVRALVRPPINRAFREKNDQPEPVKG